MSYSKLYSRQVRRPVRAQPLLLKFRSTSVYQRRRGAAIWVGLAPLRRGTKRGITLQSHSGSRWVGSVTSAFKRRTNQHLHRCPIKLKQIASQVCSRHHAPVDAWTATWAKSKTIFDMTAMLLPDPIEGILRLDILRRDSHLEVDTHGFLHCVMDGGSRLGAAIRILHQPES